MRHKGRALFTIRSIIALLWASPRLLFLLLLLLWRQHWLLKHMRSPVPVAAPSGKILQADPSDHPVQRVRQQCFLAGDETPQRGFQLQRHQQTHVVGADHLHTMHTWNHRVRKHNWRKTNKLHVRMFGASWTCRSSSREPPRLISPSGMSGWRLCRKP